MSTSFLKTFYIGIFGDAFLTFAFSILGIFAILIIIQSFEVRKSIIARLKKKEVKVVGGTTIFNFKNPPEKWIEQ